MKHNQLIILLVFFLVFGANVNAQKFHDYSLENQENKNIALNTLRGKKIMLLILGGANMDTVVIKKLISFETRFKDSIKIIAMLSYEDGYKGEDIALLLKENKNALSSVIFTKGYFTRKGSKQSPLVKWLTEKEQNRHFAQEVKGIGQKFFIDESGDLYAVLGPEIKLDSKWIERVVSRK